jgi:cell division protein FtsL
VARYSEAYDLERFQPREPRLVALADNKKAVESKRKRAARQARLNVVVYLSVALVAMGLIAYFITCNVQLTEMNKSIADKQSQLGTLQSEQVRLEAELAGLTSAEQINNYAQENGLLPIDGNQVYYIAASDQDEVSLAAAEGNWFTRTWEAICNFLS